ncbi:unknown protein [Nostoc sp. NIES-3756]|uniref:hypothetical protein n=1 Tax=Nostoc sp. NIES-3756 TaxID=1751286 RepID=UPI0007223089|nr:hypothetical protein [Nostoc sp. NIES-3756]BAT55593.1 unknown protein [Nostoc sp. NIES-3756]BAY36645.1 hypothetical protein NIES2111_09760 [Nostoc sp. NIES-2111]
MTQAKLVKLAKQGNTQAIAFLMNRHLKPKGISAKVILKDACLQVMLESAKVPNQQALVEFVQKGITSLGTTAIERVKVYGQQLGEELPAWTDEFRLDIREAVEEPHTFTVSIILNGNNECGLTTHNFENIAERMTNDILSSCKDYLIKKVSVSNGISVISKEC